MATAKAAKSAARRSPIASRLDLEYIGAFIAGLAAFGVVTMIAFAVPITPVATFDAVTIFISAAMFLVPYTVIAGGYTWMMRRKQPHAMRSAVTAGLTVLALILLLIPVMDYFSSTFVRSPEANTIINVLGISLFGLIYMAALFVGKRYVAHLAAVKKGR
jgi:hypothetical protein